MLRVERLPALDALRLGVGAVLGVALLAVEALFAFADGLEEGEFELFEVDPFGFPAALLVEYHQVALGLGEEPEAATFFGRSAFGFALLSRFAPGLEFGGALGLSLFAFGLEFGHRLDDRLVAARTLRALGRRLTVLELPGELNAALGLPARPFPFVPGPGPVLLCLDRLLFDGREVVELGEELGEELGADLWILGLVDAIEFAPSSLASPVGLEALADHPRAAGVEDADRAHVLGIRFDVDRLARAKRLARGVLLVGVGARREAGQVEGRGHRRLR